MRAAPAAGDQNGEIDRLLLSHAAVPPDATPEAQARQRIDALLTQAGWAVQDRSGVNLAAAEGVAVRELPSAGGEADYGLFLGNQLVGVVEAKKLGSTLGGVEAQTLAYASTTLPGLVVPVRPLPFRYESTGAETFCTNGLEPDAAARRLFCFHRPETLRQWLSTRQTLKGRMREAQALNRAGMWPAQIRAVENLELCGHRCARRQQLTTDKVTLMRPA